MNLMLAFLALCIIAGLWAPAKSKLGGVIAAAAVLLVLVFLFLPNRL